MRYLLPILLSLIPAFASAQLQAIQQLPGIAHPRYQTSGYAKHIFYWSVKAKKQTAHTPIIIWTSGGPGSSSLFGFFEENGPYHCAITSKQKPLFTTSTTHADWSQFSNLVVFDQPLGIGLSFAKKNQYPRSPAAGTTQYYHAVKAFFISHPTLLKHPLYLAGESYGATYITLLAKQLQLHPIKHLKLKGLIMISGWVIPQIQYQALLPTLLYRHIINKKQFQRLQPYQKLCTHCNVNQASCFADCQQLDEQISKITHHLNLHDITQPHPEDWTQAPWIKCMNNTEVRTAIHAKLQHQYYPMTNIWDNYGYRQLFSRLPIIKSLLKHNIKLMVISGYNDLSPSGYAATKKWLKKIAFHFKNEKNWVLNNKKLGTLTQSGNASWLVVLNAGHTVPTYQPMIKSIVKDFTKHQRK